MLGTQRQVEEDCAYAAMGCRHSDWLGTRKVIACDIYNSGSNLQRCLRTSLKVFKVNLKMVIEAVVCIYCLVCFFV